MSNEHMNNLVAEIFAESKDAIRQQVIDKTADMVRDQLRYSLREKINQMVDEYLDEHVKPQVEVELASVRDELVEAIRTSVQSASVDIGKLFAERLTEIAKKNLEGYSGEDVMRRLIKGF